MFELIDQAFTGVQPRLPANSRRGKPRRDQCQVLGGHPVEVAHRPAIAVDLALQRRADNHRMLLRSAGLYLVLTRKPDSA